MTRSGRIMLAVVCIIGAISILLVLPMVPKGKPICVGLALLCLAISASAFEGKHKPVTNRIVAGMIFLMYASYVVIEAKSGRLFPRHLGDCSLLSSMVGMFLFGLPSLYVLIHGGFGFSVFKQDE